MSLLLTQLPCELHGLLYHIRALQTISAAKVNEESLLPLKSARAGQTGAKATLSSSYPPAANVNTSRGFFQHFSSRLFWRDMGDALYRRPEIQPVSNVNFRFGRRNIGWLFLEKRLALVPLLGII
jgi:hypothetical protein